MELADFFVLPQINYLRATPVDGLQERNKLQEQKVRGGRSSLQSF